MNERHIDGLIEACDTVHQAIQLQQVLEARLNPTLREYLNNATTWKFRTELACLQNQQSADDSETTAGHPSVL